MTTNLPQKMVWGVFMASGGHFAAAVFDKYVYKYNIYKRVSVIDQTQ